MEIYLLLIPRSCITTIFVYIHMLYYTYILFCNIVYIILYIYKYKYIYIYILLYYIYNIIYI